jgi:hypothetical protein
MSYAESFCIVFELALCNCTGCLFTIVSQNDLHREKEIDSSDVGRINKIFSRKSHTLFFEMWYFTSIGRRFLADSTINGLPSTDDKPSNNAADEIEVTVTTTSSLLQSNE